MERVVILALLAVILAKGASGSEFLISQWCGPTEATPEQFAEAAGAGFNVIMFGGSVEQNKKALDLCQANGVKAMIIDSRIMGTNPRNRGFPANLDAVVADYGSHPALWGYYLMDEPNSSDFKRLAAVNQYLAGKDPKHIGYINLFPTYATPEQLGSPTYEAHVDEFLRVVRPRLLSYDHYALFEKTERADYFENLEIIRRQSIKHKTPFNYILLAIPHGPYRDPSETDLRWQVNTALAYGARGIMYFTYMTPHDPAWNYHGGIIDANGHRTAKYEWVRKINTDLAKLAPTLMRLNSTAVYHTGTVPSGAKSLPEGGLIAGIGPGECVIGQFRSNEGQLYAMFVNRSLRERADAGIVFSRPVRLYEVSPATGRRRAVPVRSEGRSCVWQVRFEPGQGRLVQVDPVEDLPVEGWDDQITFRPRVMLNPSVQFGNVIGDADGAQLYNEGLTMYDIAMRVLAALQRDGRVDAFVSRNFREQDVGLRYETKLTRRLDCDALVSLHSDATGTDDPGGGTWTFYADELEGKRLAECIQTRLLDAIQSFYPEVLCRGVRTHWHRLWVLHESGCPASLTEVLFHTNPKEREMLKDPARQEIMADAVARGILDYFGLV